MTRSDTKLNTAALVIRWIARVWSLFSIGFVLLILVGELVSPHAALPSSLRDIVGMFFFPFGVCVGLVLAWKWEALGGLIALGSLVAFYFTLYIFDGRFPRGPFFALVAAPGALFLIGKIVSSRAASPSSRR